ncbi:MAG: hypothetical protein R3B06_08455 [Kofleriaceae bacterium]
MRASRGAIAVVAIAGAAAAVWAWQRPAPRGRARPQPVGEGPAGTAPVPPTIMVPGRLGAPPVAPRPIGGGSADPMAPEPTEDAPTDLQPVAGQGAPLPPGVAPRGSAAVGQPQPGRVALAAEPKTYVLDNGAVVRDHRAGVEQAPLGPPPLPPNERTMSPVVTAQIYRELAPRVRTCGAAVPTNERGADPFVYVTLTVAVTGGQLSTTDVEVAGHDLAGPATDAFLACIHTDGMTITLADTGEPDRRGYIVQYPIRVR